MEKKKIITLSLIGVLELAVIAFCLVSAILVLTSGFSSAPSNEQAVWYENHPGMVGWMCVHPTQFFLICVLPPIVLFVIDGIYLIMYATKKESLLSKEEKQAIAEEAKRQATEEILKELREQSKQQGEDK